MLKVQSCTLLSLKLDKWVLHRQKISSHVLEQEHIFEDVLSTFLFSMRTENCQKRF